MIIIERFAFLEKATVGRMFCTGANRQLFTLERPWQSNKPFTSCIPNGTYQLARHEGGKWDGRTLLKSVPDRSFILVHPGNFPTDSSGCILPGMDFTLADDTASVSDSREACALFEEWREAGEKVIQITQISAEVGK